MTSQICLPQVRPGRVGTRDLYEDGGPEESGDRVRAEGLRRSGDLPDAGGGGHLQGPGEQRAKTTKRRSVWSPHSWSLMEKTSADSFLLGSIFGSDRDPGRDRSGAGARPAAHQEQVQSAV